MGDTIEGLMFTREVAAQKGTSQKKKTGKLKRFRLEHMDGIKRFHNEGLAIQRPNICLWL